MDGPVIRPLVRLENAISRGDDERLTRGSDSFDPAAEKTCERLIDLALETDQNNVEALQALASVRLSQQRPDEARQCLERAWNGWKDLDPGAYSNVSRISLRQLTTLRRFFGDTMVICVAQMTRRFRQYRSGCHSSNFSWSCRCSMPRYLRCRGSWDRTTRRSRRGTWKAGPFISWPSWPTIHQTGN